MTLNKSQSIENISADFCVIGGGLSGICAAVAAARRGLKVVLINDRPVLGGNASSEVKMWVRGASTAFPFYRESGLIEEIAMRNTYYNPTMSYGIFDGVLYDLVTAEPNITLLLNASVNSAEQHGDSIKSVSAWQLTTYKNIKVTADYFADCSGDCILAEFTNAAYMRGRESKQEFTESLAVDIADDKTMGNSCLIQARETDYEVSYIPPSFARKLTDKEFNHRIDINCADFFKRDNFWWMELCGDRDSIKDAENTKKELLSLAYGVWDYIKNSGRFDSKTWELDWVGFLGGKRESRRYKGAYTLDQNDIDTPKNFFDEVAYGGWTMDDHNPQGFNTSQPPNHHHKISAPYAIPYRCLYSENIKNLFFAGRNISATHIALSSTRVMATCASLGQAVGTACALALNKKIMPAKVLEHIEELKQNLRDDDCFLLNTKRKTSIAMLNALSNLSKSDTKLLFNGTERKLTASDKAAVSLEKGKAAEFKFDPAYVSKIRIVFDNDIARESYTDKNFKLYPNRLNIPKQKEIVQIPEVLTKHFSVYIETNGKYEKLFENENNFNRLVYVPVNKTITSIRLICHETYGENAPQILSIDVI